MTAQQMERFFINRIFLFFLLNFSTTVHVPSVEPSVEALSATTTRVFVAAAEETTPGRNFFK
jgi:hypothetical protein